MTERQAADWAGRKEAQTQRDFMFNFFPVLPSLSSSSDSMMILILAFFMAPQVPETLSIAFSIFCSLCYPYHIIFIDTSSSSQIIFSVISILL